MNAAVEIVGVSKSYGKNNAIQKPFSCSIRDGSTTVLLGQNGAGKTTLIRIILDLIRSDSGTVMINGKCSSDPSSREGVRYLPESVVFPSKCNFNDLVRNYKRYRSDVSETSVMKMLEYFDISISRNRYIEQLSKGQRQLFLLSLIMSGDPSLLILDEPMDGLDPINTRRVRQRIKDLSSKGTTVFQSTHRIHEAEVSGGEYIIINNGTIATTGAIKSIKKYSKVPAEHLKGNAGITDLAIYRDEEYVYINKAYLCEHKNLSDIGNDMSLEDMYIVAMNTHDN